MRFIRFLFFLPILLFVSPALILLGFVILLSDTKEGPLRTLLADEVRKFGFTEGFERFMQRVFIPTYTHNVHSFVLGGAGFLVVVVGLRGLGMLPVELVFVALGVEFTLLNVWAVTTFYTAEEPITESAAILSHQKTAPQESPPPSQPSAADFERLVHALNEASSRFSALPDTEKLVQTMVDMSGKLSSVLNSEKLMGSLNEVSAHLSLLENRLRTTESRFEQLANLDASLQALTAKLGLIVSDQFNQRVRHEFDQLLSELGNRTSGDAK